MSLVVIIPTYNEKENVENIINEVFHYVPNSQILIVDDNSPDGTSDIVKKLQKNDPRLHLLMRKGKEGLGKAYIHAFKHVFDLFVPSRVAMMDSDMSHHPKYLPEMEKLLDKGADVIVGSRYVIGGDTVGWEKWRKALSYYGNIYARFITGIPVKDLTAGFYMMNANVLKSVNFNDFDSSGYAFQIEFKNLLKNKGSVFVEHPIVFGNRTGGESKISNHIISEGIIAPWKIRFKK